MQISGAGWTADERSSKHALKLLLILGGFVAIWWALMTGVAHAESTPQHPVRHGLDSLTASAKAHHPTPVHDVVRRVHHEVEATTAKAHQTTSHVRHQARPVVHTASHLASSAPIASHVTKAVRTTVSDTVSKTVSDTVAKTRNLLHKTAAGPVLDDVDEVVKHTIEKPESSTGQGNSHSLRPSGKASANSLADHFPGLPTATSETSGHGSATPAGTDRATSSINDDSPAQSPFGTPTVPGPCASPSGSGSSSTTPVGITESSLLVMPTVLRDHCSWRLARLPGGPAYEPGSSPD